LVTPQSDQWDSGSSGSYPVAGDGNTGVGIYSLEAVSTGAYNTAIGYRSGGNQGGSTMIQRDLIIPWLDIWPIALVRVLLMLLPLVMVLQQMLLIKPFLVMDPAPGMAL